MREASLAERVYRRLKAAINSLEMPPGSPLGEVELARAFRTSRTPVREALRRLQAEGLVAIVPRRGASVGGTSIREVIEAYEIRELLEPLAAMRAAQRGLDARAVEQLLARLNRLTDTEPLSSDELAERESVDSDLHALIAEASGNELLKKVVVDMRARVQRVFVHLGMGGRFKRSREEHLEILRTIEKGDGGQAGELMRRHLERSKEWLLGRGLLLDHYTGGLLRRGHARSRRDRVRPA